MRDVIVERLRLIEEQENIKILYACESGSRAWGFPSKDSDYDVRFIYLREVEWYLRVDHEYKRDVIERPINDLLDISGWDLKKSLKLLKSSNPALIEWFDSPMVYKKQEAFYDEFKSLISRYYSPMACFHHYISMAKKTFNAYLQGETIKLKKYFYALRPILAASWIEKGFGIAPIKFEPLVEKLIDDPALLSDIRMLLEEKKKGLESEYSPKINSISQFIDKELERLTKVNFKFQSPKNDFVELNKFFLKNLDL